MNWYQNWGHCGVSNDLGNSPQLEGEARGLWWASYVVGDTTMTEIDDSQMFEKKSVLVA